MDANRRVLLTAAFLGAGARATELAAPTPDRLELAQAATADQPVLRVAPTAPEALRLAPRRASTPPDSAPRQPAELWRPLTPREQGYVNPPINRARLLAKITSDANPCRPDRQIHAALAEARRQPNGEELYQRALDEIAADIRANTTNRVAHALAVLESLRDPNSHDGRGHVAADLYQRIDPPTSQTPVTDRAGRLTPEERTLLGVPPAQLPELARPGVGGPDWTKRLSSFDSRRIDVELPSGASDYMSYKPYRYGTARTIETLKRVAERYRDATGLMLRVGDIAARGGGRIPDHVSHRTGNIVDLDLAFNDGRITAEPDRDGLNASWRSPAYDQANTRRLIQIIKAIRPEAQILFNDPVLVREGLVTRVPNHDNHLHVQRLN